MWLRHATRQTYLGYPLMLFPLPYFFTLEIELVSSKELIKVKENKFYHASFPAVYIGVHAFFHLCKIGFIDRVQVKDGPSLENKTNYANLC